MNTLVMAIKAIYAVWRRHVMTYFKMIWPVMANNVANPLLYLFSFGFGLGAVIPVMTDTSGYEMPYLHYVLPGMMAYSVMFAASFETSVSAYARMTMQMNWNAILSTPVSLHELLLGELAWATTKAMLAAVSVMIAGYAFGGIPSGWFGLTNLIVMLGGAFVFASFGLLSTSLAKGFEHFNYFFTFWVTPMFMFSGVFFPVERFPESVQYLTYIFPMTYVLDIARPISAGLPLDGVEVLKDVTVLVLMAVFAYSLAYRKIKQRLFT